MADPQMTLAQLLPLLMAGGGLGGAPRGQPLANAAPTFNSATGGVGGGGGMGPANFGGGALMPQQQQGGGNNMSSMLPLLMAMQKNNQQSGGSGGGKGGLFGGKGGGSAPTAMDMMSYGGLGDASSANSIAAMAGGFG